MTTPMNNDDSDEDDAGDSRHGRGCGQPNAPDGDPCASPFRSLGAFVGTLGRLYLPANSVAKSVIPFWSKRRTIEWNRKKRPRTLAQRPITRKPFSSVPWRSIR